MEDFEFADEVVVVFDKEWLPQDAFVPVQITVSKEEVENMDWKCRYRAFFHDADQRISKIILRSNGNDKLYHAPERKMEQEGGLDQ